MIKHIVFWNLADTAEGKSKAENALIIKADLENLIHEIPQIKKIEVGINHPDAPAGNYDLALYSEFETMDDLDIYQKHPAHQQAASYVKQVVTARVCVDYE